MRARFALAALAATCLTALPASLAQAQRTVVVAPFSGSGGTNVTRQVAGAIRDSVDVVSSRAASRAARQAGVRGAEPGGVPEFAEAVSAEIAILGEVETSGGRRQGRRRRRRRAAAPAERTVRMVAYDASGRELTRGEVSYGPRDTSELEGAAIALLSRAVAAVEAAAAPPPRTEPPPRFEPEPEPEPPSETPADGLAVLSGWFGLVVRSREAFVGFESDDERRYGATYAELGLALELRPFASEGHLGRGTFVSFDFFHSVGLGSVVDASGDGVSTNFARLQLTAGWMAPLGEMVELGAGLGGGYEGYHFGPNPILPTSEIAYVRAAARGRVRLVEETLVLELDLAYRAVLGLGDVGGAFGQDAETHGLDLGVGLTGNLARVAELGFTWAMRFQYVGYFTSFGGVALDTPATSGSEESFRLTLLAGWSF